MNVFLSHIRKQCVCTLQCALLGGQIDGAWSSRRKKVKTLPVKFIILFYVCINYECEATGSKESTERENVWSPVNTHTRMRAHQRLIRRKNKKGITKEMPELLFASSHQFSIWFFFFLLGITCTREMRDGNSLKLTMVDGRWRLSFVMCACRMKSFEKFSHDVYIPDWQSFENCGEFVLKSICFPNKFETS